LISAGGSAGALVGPALAVVLAPRIGPTNLLPLAAAVLSIALICIARLRRRATASRGEADEAAAVGGGALGGVVLLLRSRYLLAICAFMALATTLSTFVYFQQAQITARVITRWGLTRTLPVLPALSLVGFAALAVAPITAVLVPFQVARRAAQYAITGPAREVLFTVISREEKYKAKNVIDTVVYRGGDALSGWAFSGLVALGLGLSGIAIVALPLTAACIALAVYLGREEAVRRGRPRTDVSPNFGRGTLPR
jgi:AAA family ATP:ADP antiporter